jgi:predicted P-loop ATPase
MIDLDALLATPLAHAWGETIRTHSRASEGGLSPELARAHALAARLAPSVEGHGGDEALLKAATELATILGEDSQAIGAVLIETFNPRCAPPWPTAKIAREAERAALRQASPEARYNRRAAQRAAVEAPPPDADPTALAFHAPDEIDAPEPLAFDVTRQGTPRPTTMNVLRALEQWFGERIRFEECAGRIVVANADEIGGLPFPDGDWTDAHTTALVALCDQHSLHVTPAVVDRAVELHARNGSYNVLTEFLMAAALAWDGVPRVDAALCTYWHCEDTPAVRATSRIFFLSLAARGLEPGCKVDTCPIFVGAQGLRKSTAFVALVGKPWFSDSPLPIGDKDAMQNLRGAWLWEFAELASVLRAREWNTIKCFVSSGSDRFRASYGRHVITIARQTCFVASTNDRETLTDPTGNRRFLPVDITREIDVFGIHRDREQLLGEAAARVLGGEEWHPTRDEAVTLKIASEAHEERDIWEDAIATWCARRESRKAGPFALDEIFDMTGPVPIVEERRNVQIAKRVGAILRALGYERSKQWKGTRTDMRGRWVWSRR